MGTKKNSDSLSLFTTQELEAEINLRKDSETAKKKALEEKWGKELSKQVDIMRAAVAEYSRIITESKYTASYQGDNINAIDDLMCEIKSAGLAKQDESWQSSSSQCY